MGNQLTPLTEVQAPSGATYAYTRIDSDDWASGDYDIIDLGPLSRGVLLGYIRYAYGTTTGSTDVHLQIQTAHSAIPGSGTTTGTTVASFSRSANYQSGWGVVYQTLETTGTLTLLADATIGTSYTSIEVWLRYLEPPPVMPPPIP